MKSLFWILALFALAVGISLSARVGDAYVLFVLPPYRAEISLVPAILLAVIGFVVLYALLRLVALASSLPRRMRESSARKKREKAAKSFGKAVRLYLEGEKRKAAAVAAKLRNEEDWSDLAALLAERASDAAATTVQEAPLSAASEMAAGQS